MKTNRHLSTALLILLGIVVIGCVFFVYRDAKEAAQLNQIRENISDYMYGQLDEAGSFLEYYVHSENEADLLKATDAIGKAAAVGASLKDSTIYQNQADTADDTIKIWGTLLLIQTYKYLENIQTTGVDKPNLEVIELLSETFQPLPDSGSHVTFMSLYWNASSSGLANLPEWSTIMHYDDGILQWPDF